MPYIIKNGKKVFAPFFKYNQEARTWNSKEDYEKDFLEFRRSDFKETSHSKPMVNIPLIEAFSVWARKPEHMGEQGHKIYEARKQRIINQRFRKAITNTKHAKGKPIDPVTRAPRKPK